MEAVMLLTLSWACSLLVYMTIPQVAAQKTHFVKNKSHQIRLLERLEDAEKLQNIFFPVDVLCCGGRNIFHA